jgi:hypothetical protein
MESGTLSQFSIRYTAAWCSQRAASVASFFADQGSLKITDEPPAIGRDAITNTGPGGTGKLSGSAVLRSGASGRTT